MRKPIHKMYEMLIVSHNLGNSCSTLMEWHFFSLFCYNFILAIAEYSLYDELRSAERKWNVCVRIPMLDGFGYLISMSHVHDWTLRLIYCIHFTFFTTHISPYKNTMNQQKRRLFYYFYYLLNGISITFLFRIVCVLLSIHLQPIHTHSHINVSRHRFYLCWLFTFIMHSHTHTQT